MAIFNKELWLNEKTYTSDAQTLIEELPEAGVLSLIDIRLQAQNGATSNKGSDLLRGVVSKIEVRDGAKIIFSADARALNRINWLEMGKFPTGIMDEAPNVYQTAHFYIPFGRHLGDKAFALDLGKLKNPDIRITYNLAAVNAVGATGFVSGTTTLTVTLWRAESGAVIPQGYAKYEEVKTFTTAASGDEPTELPTLNKYLAIYVYCREDGVGDDTDLTKYELKNIDKALIVSEGNWNDTQEDNAQKFNVETEVKGRVFAADADTFYTYAGTLLDARLAHVFSGTIGTTDMPIYRIASVVGDQVTIQAYSIEGTATYTANAAYAVDGSVMWEAHGTGVGNLICIPTVQTEDWSDALDTATIKTLRLTLTQAGAGGTVYVLTKEIVTA